MQNLHRQILYTPADLHYPKAEVAARRLQELNPLVKAEAFTENVNAGNVERLLQGVDCVVDGLDNMVTRYLVNRACVKLKIPYVFGAAIGIEGNLSVFPPPQTGCLECLMPNLSDNDLLTCSTRGVIGATPGIIGAMQAMETIKLLADVGTNFEGQTVGLRLQRHGFHHHRHLQKHPLPSLPRRIIRGCWRRAAGLALRTRHSQHKP